MANQADNSVSQEQVTVFNYLDAKTAFHFNRVLKLSGGVNKWLHVREPIPLDKQRIKRMNRDTLYSSALVDVSKGTMLYLPESNRRYLSAAVINQTHHINKVFHGPGPHALSTQDLGSKHVLVTVRILVNSEDDADLKTVNVLQNQLKLESNSADPYNPISYDPDSLSKTTKLLSELASSMKDAAGAFGSELEVDRVKHLLATAYGWGGLPKTEAYYINSQSNLKKSSFSMTFDRVPVEGFWSVSVYNKAGYFEANQYRKYSYNSLTAEPNQDGSFTVHFGGDKNSVNFLPVSEDWNYVIRLYQPQQQVLDGSWTAPSLKALD